MTKKTDPRTTGKAMIAGAAIGSAAIAAALLYVTRRKDTQARMIAPPHPQAEKKRSGSNRR